MNTLILNKLSNKINLSRDEAIEAMDSIMSGDSTNIQIAAFLTALKIKGETIEEISSSVTSIKRKATKVKYQHENLVDCCGTGGDNSNTFNISTTAAFISAGAGVKIAKHGNRAITSKSGGADVLENLGIVLTSDEKTIIKCIDEANIGFLFAPNHHASFKYAAPVRKELGFRTIFNLLGPMVNPVMVNKQVMGVYDKSLVKLCANVLNDLGVERAMVIFGEDGLDEITLTGLTYVAEIKDKKVIEYTINPKDFGFELCSSKDILGSTPEVNANILLSVLNGQPGPARDISIINAAASIYISGICNSFEEGINKAKESIDKKYALNKFELLKTITRGE